MLIEITPDEAAELQAEVQDQTRIPPVRIKLPAKLRKKKTNANVPDLRQVLKKTQRPILKARKDLSPKTQPQQTSIKVKSEEELQEEQPTIRSVVFRTVKSIKVRIKARINSINKPDEILFGESNPSYKFTTEEDPGFHINDEFYYKVIEESKENLQQQEPLQTFKTEGWDYKIEDPTIDYKFTNMDKLEEQHTVKLPLTFLQRTNMPDPVIHVIDNDCFVDIQVTFVCNVTPTEHTGMLSRVPFPTNKQACENAVTRLKQVAFYSTTMMPHVTMCKLNELLHMFRLESANIFTKSWPTTHPLPPIDESQKKFHQIITGGIQRPRPATTKRPRTTTPGQAETRGSSRVEMHFNDKRPEPRHHRDRDSRHYQGEHQDRQRSRMTTHQHKMSNFNRYNPY